MSVQRVLDAYPALEPKLLLVLHLLKTDAMPEELPIVNKLKQYLDLLGPEVVSTLSNTYLNNENEGKLDIDYIVKLVMSEKEIDRKCFDTNRSCWCKHVARQVNDAHVDLSHRIVAAVVETVAESVGHI